VVLRSGKNKKLKIPRMRDFYFLQKNIVYIQACQVPQHKPQKYNVLQAFFVV
jgi:hypothetical protein